MPLQNSTKPKTDAFFVPVAAGHSRSWFEVHEIHEASLPEVT